MKILGLAYFGFCNIANALVVPVSPPLISSFSNSSITVLANRSINNNTPSQVAELGLPLRLGFAGLEDYDLLWSKNSHQISVDTTNQLSYNLYNAVLHFWASTSNQPFDKDLLINTKRYPQIITWVYPNRPPYLVTPGITAAVLWNMLDKCLMPEPPFSNVIIVTKGGDPVTIGEFDSDYYPHAAPSPALDSSASNPPTSNFSEYSLTPQSIPTLSARRIETHIYFQGPPPPPPLSATSLPLLLPCLPNPT